MNNKCSQKWASPGISSYRLRNVNGVRRMRREATYGVVQMTNCNVKTGGGFVSLSVVHEHGLESVRELDDSVFAVILLGLAYRLGEHEERGSRRI